jgi:hypothetical protein
MMCMVFLDFFFGVMSLCHLRKGIASDTLRGVRLALLCLIVCCLGLPTFSNNYNHVLDDEICVKAVGLTSCELTTVSKHSSRYFN